MRVRSCWLPAALLAALTGAGALAQDFPYLLVSDFNNDVVRRYDANTGAFVDVFIPTGSGDSLVNGPQGLAIGPDGDVYVGMLYSSVTGNTGIGRINRYNGRTGAFVSTFFGGNLNRVYGMTFGPDGKLYVSSAQNHRILRYDTLTGTSEIVAEGGFTGQVFAVPHAMTFDANGNLYFSCVNGGSFPFHRVLKITANQLAGPLPVTPTIFIEGVSLPLNSPPQDNRLAGPRGLLFGPDANNDGTPDLYVLSRGGANTYTGAIVNAVLRYDGLTGAYIDTFVPSGSGGLNVPLDLKYGPDNNLYITHSGTPTSANGVYRYNGTTGDFLDTFVINPAAGLNGPTFMAFQPRVVLLSGVLQLQGRTSASVPTLVTFQPAGGGVPFSKFVTPQASGALAVTILPGAYYVKVKPRYYLAKVFSGEVSSDLSGLDLGEFLAGDANDDNAVDVLDLSILIEAFDAGLGDPNWNPGADFNNDGGVDVFDLDLLISNFDAVGDELP